MSDYWWELYVYINGYLKFNTSDLEYYSLWRVKLYGEERITQVIVDYLMLINYRMPHDTDNTKWNEDVHYALKEVVGQYSELLTNYQVDNRIKYSEKWDVKQDISEQYLNSMIIALHIGDKS